MTAEQTVSIYSIIALHFQEVLGVIVEQIPFSVAIENMELMHLILNTCAWEQQEWCKTN